MNNNKLNTSALALGCGVLSIVIGLMGGFSSNTCALLTTNNACLGGVFGIIMQLVGIAAGVVGVFLSLNEQKTAIITEQSSNLAVAALIVSIIGVAVSFIGTICMGICVCKVNGTINSFTTFYKYL